MSHASNRLSGPQRVLRLVLAASALQIGVAGVGLAAPPSVEERRRELEKIEAILADLPRDSFDPQAVVDRVGRDPEQLFMWVRDNTRWVPYRGALRGPAGVLMDRQGSSLDRSLLLAELLAKAGHEARLAFAELPNARIEQHLEGFKTAASAPAAAPPRETADDASAAEAYFKEHGIDPQELRQWVEDAKRKSQAGLQQTREDAEKQMTLLAIALGETGEAPADAEDRWQTPLQELRLHWWVQVKTGGAWTALDPALRDAKFGASPLKANRSCDPADVPAAEYHEVDLAVVIEKSDGSQLTEAEVLKETLRPVDLLGHRITLAFMPLDVLGDENLTPDAGQALAKLAPQQRRWAPVLNAGPQPTLQKGFTDRGAVIEPPFTGAVAAVGEGATALGGRLGLGLRRAPAETRLTAVWLDYEIRTPGRRPLKIRRPVLDLVGPAARAENSAVAAAATDEDRAATMRALLGRTEILLQNCKLSPLFVLANMAGAVVENSAAILEATGPELAGAIDNALGAVPGTTAMFAMARFHSSPVADNVFIDVTNVLNHRTFFEANNAGEWKAVEVFDIVNNEIGVAPEGAAGALRLKQGVADTAAEGRLLSHASAGACGVLAAAAAGGAEFRTLRTAADFDEARLAGPADALQRIQASLKDGLIVVVPAKTAELAGTERLAWWRIDPRTGSVLGVLDSGYHGATGSLLGAGFLFAPAAERPAVESTTAWKLFLTMAPWMRGANRAAWMMDVMVYASGMGYSSTELQALANAMARFFGLPTR